MALCQYEGAAAPANTFSLYIQDRRGTRSYILYEDQVTISTSREDSFAIFQGAYISYDSTSHLFCVV